MFAVVEFNQASGMPDDTAWLRDSADEAQELADAMTESSARGGRRERYRVYELIEVEGEEGRG